VNQARRSNRNRRNQDNKTVLRTGLREIVMFFFFFAALYLFISLFTYYPLDPAFSHPTNATPETIHNKGGLAGAYFADLFFYWFGYFAYLFVFMVGYAGWLFYQGRHHDLLAEPKHLLLPTAGFILTIVAGCGLAIVHFAAESALLPSHAGGILGSWVGNSLKNIISSLGATLFLMVMFFLGITLLTGLSWLKLMDILGFHTLRMLPIIGNTISNRLIPFTKKHLISGWQLSKQGAGQMRQTLQTGREQLQRIRQSKAQQPPIIDDIVEPPKTEEPSATSVESVQTPVPMPSQLPPEKLREQLLQLLQIFNITALIKNFETGPIITQITLQAADPESFHTLIESQQRLAERLNAQQLHIANISLDTVTLEIPHSSPEPIYLSRLLKLQHYVEIPSPLSIVLGKDNTGHPIIVDISRMPHVLLVGSNTSEIDNALHVLLLSLLYKASPTDARLILIDSANKVLSEYNLLQNLLAPVITEHAQSIQALKWCLAEMDRRYRLMADLGVRNIEGYNRRVKTTSSDSSNDHSTELEIIPYLVIVIYEIDGLLQNEMEELITRLAQKARASGIHLVLATNNAKNVSALMKANFPTRMTFKVEDKADSRNLINQTGAEHLLGNGDMFYLTSGNPSSIRVHGAQISLPEIRQVLDELRKHSGKTQYQDLSVLPL
jgi:DNA segregation ATPase FtsK/SpoIIIE, S-DNA-T family